MTLKSLKDRIYSIFDNFSDCETFRKLDGCKGQDDLSFIKPCSTPFEGTFCSFLGKTLSEIDKNDSKFQNFSEYRALLKIQ